MDGTRYVDGVLVDTTQLSRTEDSKAFHILRDRLDNWEPGTHSGLRLTVNPVNTSRVDLSAGTGYALDGEFVEVLADQLNIQLADTALGAVNWVVVFYTETKASPNPHETNGTIQPTENQRGIRVRVLTPTDFDLLPLTDPTYASDAQDRALLVGIVTGTGGALTSSSIEQPPAWRSVKYAVMANPPMSGVAIYKVSDDTPEGDTGALKLETAPLRLSWQAPTEAGFGPSVNIIADDTYTLTALGGSTIQVVVTVAALPTANTQVTVVVYGLYTQEVPRMSSTDRHHRSMLGTGIPSPTNPHGLSLDDITPGFATDITVHQQLMHANGIWRGSLATCLQVSIDEVPNPDRLLITAPAGNDCYWVHGKRLTAIQNTVLDFTPPITTKRALFEIVVDNVGNVKYSQRVEHTGTNLTGNLTGIVFVNDEVLAGGHTLSWLSLGPGAGGYLSWDNALTPVRVLPGVTSGLFLLRNGKQEVWFYIGDINQLPAPAGLYSDVITVFAPPLRTENLLLAQVFYDGDSDGHLGYTNNRGTVPALLVDLRLFGTLLDYHIRDDALRTMVEYPMDEHHANGVAIGRMDFQGAYGSLWAEKPATGLTLTVWGQAPVYVRGKRYIVGSFTSPLSVTVPDNDTTVIYIDIDGNVAQTPLLWAAFLLVNTFDAFESTKFYKTSTNLYANQPWVYTGTPIAVVASAGGNVVRVIDLRRNLAGGNVNIRPWTVGSIEPTPLFPAYESVEFYSLDTALLYALVQGQERIECVYATLANPTTIPYVIPTLKNMALTGTLFIDADWSFLSTVFRVGDGANITFQDLQIFRAPGFVGAATLSLVETTVGATEPSTITFDNVEVDWLTNGHLAHFIATGPSECNLIVDDLLVTCDAGTSSLFQFDIVTKSAIRGLKTLGVAGPAAVIGATVEVTTTMSDCVGNIACDVANIAGGNLLRGAFTGLWSFHSMLSNGGMFLATWSSCSFDILDVENIARSNFAGCSFTTLTAVGSAAAKGSYVSFASCYFQGGVSFYCDHLQVAGSVILGGVAFGGEHMHFSGTQIGGGAVHNQWATHDVVFSGCDIGSFEHSSVVDFYDWHIVGGSVGAVQLIWDTEELHDFSISEASINGYILFKPATLPAVAAKRLHGVISHCNVDQTALPAHNVQFLFCQNVRFVHNHVPCNPSFALPPIQIGEWPTPSGAQVFRGIDINHNTFSVDEVTMDAPIAEIGVPIILVAFTSGTGTGISISNNRFEWASASASVLANRVVGIFYYGSSCSGAHFDHNHLYLEGNSASTAWAGGGGPFTAARLGLAKGMSAFPIGYDCHLEATTIIGNVFELANAGTADKWLCHDFSFSFTTSPRLLGNTSMFNKMHAVPLLPGVAGTDNSVNDIIDNVT